MFTNEYKIKRIKSIIDCWGETSCMELNIDSMLVNGGGRKNKTINQYIEFFNVRTITLFTYDNEIIIDVTEIPYEDLKEVVISRIHNILLAYENEINYIVTFSKHFPYK